MTTYHREKTNATASTPTLVSSPEVVTADFGVQIDYPLVNVSMNTLTPIALSLSSACDRVPLAPKVNRTLSLHFLFAYHMLRFTER